jgi:hypothetical protein
MLPVRLLRRGSWVDELHNVDIYNIVAALLSIRPEPNDGDAAAGQCNFGRKKVLERIMAGAEGSERSKAVLEK